MFFQCLARTPQEWQMVKTQGGSLGTFKPGLEAKVRFSEGSVEHFQSLQKFRCFDIAFPQFVRKHGVLNGKN